ncbi:hypothetical protein BZG72_06700 [Salinivibrio sp. PR6]|uniref:Transposase n=1 Tax=Salinivibrio siamensis TaxID=414286 RepID=A0ABX3KEI9_9GAMM|nr:hypothetical protein [Salinivibrio sp. VYel7]OOE68165.1 hypothetical protein BZG20_04330 [Salinivibrio sp. IB868]OOE75429.1 hypothetical protein BZG22_06330 [Salinivibrio sp. IB870]OOE83352.1 hypothetical protein BZG72_06700 [Salinivibrio sp. PR6]OOE87425.1 hypothetical protein BZG73_01945 [Salinivibrio siamensis]
MASFRAQCVRNFTTFYGLICRLRSIIPADKLTSKPWFTCLRPLTPLIMAKIAAVREWLGSISAIDETFFLFKLLSGR